jgi:PIN domain nuclease of toxin-antitoxin system
VIYVLDTHALVWHLAGSPRLGQRAAEVMLDPTAELVVPAIVLVEIQFLAVRSRIDVSLDLARKYIAEDSRCSVRVVDEVIAAMIPIGLNIHDAVICATALDARQETGELVSLVTKDRKIIASGLVQTIW